VSVAVQPTTTNTPVPDLVSYGILREGVHLPPPADAPSVFITTHPSPLLDEAVQDLQQQGILQEQPNIVNAFRLFLVAKSDGAARPVLDLSPWTPYYSMPPMRLYSAAEVLIAVPRTAQMIKIDLKSGFFQVQVRQQYTHFYGIYYRKKRYSWTRIPMGHPMAPSIMQRLATTVARHLHQECDVHMVAYLDDWLVYGHNLNVPQILHHIQQLGFQLNFRKSVLTPTTSLVYLGLHLSTVTMTITPTDKCLQHLCDLASSCRKHPDKIYNG
jgi:hypothetical protein